MTGKLRLPTRTIRAQLLLAFGALLLLGALNMIAQEWGSQQRVNAFSEVRESLERRRAIAQSMELVKDYFHHVSVLSGVVGDAVPPLPEVGRQSTRRVTDDILRHFSPLLVEESDPAVRDLGKQLEALASSWQSFHEKQAYDPAAAVAELVLRADPLAEQILTVDYPRVMYLEAQRAASATDRYLAADRAASRSAWISFLLTAGIAAFLIWITARNIGRGVDVLKDGARRIGRGDLDMRIHVAAADELSAVARAFNDMAAGLQATQRQLEERNEELDRMLQELQRTQQELVQTEKLSAMGGMLAGLAHELNNPLTSVLGFAQLLEHRLTELGDERSAEIRRELADPIVCEAIRARELVRDMLLFSRKSSAQVCSVSIEDALRLVSGLRSYAFAQAGICLDIEQEDNLWVHAEAQRLQQVFVNLSNNALDALEDGNGTRLCIRARAGEADRVEIVFEDDGPGLAEPEKVFDPFYTTKPVGSGTGLGLTLAHRFVTEFGGTIRASNRPEGGARFEISLARVPMPEHESGEPGPAAATPPSPGAPSRFAINDSEPREGVLAPTPNGTREVVPAAVNGDSPHVLVVEDEDPIRRLHIRLLHRMGARVTVVSNGVDARNLLRSMDVDLVISDVKMPGEINGLALYDWAAAERPELANRFLFVTGDIHDPALSALLRKAPERFLTKPFQLDEYALRVERALHRQLPVT